MNLSILEVLQSANTNLNSNTSLGFVMAKRQMHKAITLLDKGYSLCDLIDPLLKEYGTVENVPEKVDDDIYW